MQWNANGISIKINELLTFQHSNYVNIAAIQETKLTDKTKSMKTPGRAAVRLDRHKNKGGGLLMLTKDRISFVDNTTAHLNRPILIWSSKASRLRLPIANDCISITSTFRHVAVAALVTTHRSRTSSETTKCRLLLGILMHITPDGIRTQTKTKEANS